jgi:putative methionine-R-sulfoxide reductase with GAF domain
MIAAVDYPGIMHLTSMSEFASAREESLLWTLEEISRLVSHSGNAAETLTNIVRLIQQWFRTDVCSVYLLEPDRSNLVLAATIGLRPESVGRVRMRLNEGLAGLVAEELCPQVVEDATRHPRFKSFREADEDPYHSFLGVPLIDRGLLQGVLVVQTVEPRVFGPDVVRMLMTAGAQLAPIVGEARSITIPLRCSSGCRLTGSLNTPRRPLEASGTSGQKVVLNGGLNLSILDGWWAEAYDGLNGFAIGMGQTHSSTDIHDFRDGEALINVLREEVIPLYYDRDQDGLPRRWIARIKRAIRTLGWRFSADRMVADYVLKAYIPAAGGTSSDMARC